MEKLLPASKSQAFSWLAGLLCAMALTVYFIRFEGDKQVWLDEILTYYGIAGQSWNGFWHSMESGVNIFPATWFLLGWFVTQLVDPNPLVFRFLSFCFIALAVLLWPVLIRRHTGAIPAALMVTGLVGANHLFPLFALEGRPYGLYLLLGLLTFDSSVRTMESRTPSTRILLFNAVLQFLLPATHYIGGLYSAATLISVVVIDLCYRNIRIKVYASWLLGWMVFVFLCVPTLLIQSIDNPFGYPLPRLRLAQLLQFYQGWFAPPIGVVIVGVATILLFRNLRQRNTIKTCCLNDQLKQRGLLLLSSMWLVLPVVLWVTSCLGFSSFVTVRYLLPSVLVVPVLCGVIWRNLYDRMNPRSFYYGLSAKLQGLKCASVIILLVIFILPLFRINEFINFPYTSGYVDELKGWRGHIVTRSSMVYFENAYFEMPGQRYHLFANNASIRETFHQYNSSLSLINIDEVHAMDKFLYIQTPQDRVEFSLEGFASKQGYSITPWPFSHPLLKGYILSRRLD